MTPSQRLLHKVVSRRNWKELRPKLLSAIADADFVSFDYELTGLHSKNERFIGLSQSYDAHCQGARAFIPVQLGLCSAKLDRISGRWSLTPISVYLFPNTEPGTEDGPGRCFSVSTSALNFLAANGFDCNQWISEGLGWMKPSEEEDRRKLLSMRMDEVKNLMKSVTGTEVKDGTVPAIQLPDGVDKQAMMSLRSQVEEWLALPNSHQAHLEVPMESAFLRLIAHTYIAQEFPSLFSQSAKRGENGRVLCVYRNKDDSFREQLSGLQDQSENLDLEIGPRVLFDAISSSRIPLVGHNCFYDMLHTQHAFYEDVPQYIDQFKQKWLSRFPRTFDTKYMAESSEVLGGLQPPATLRSLCEFMLGHRKNLPVDILPIAAEFDYALPGREEADLSHDAGYDAMMTSLVFLSQLDHIIERRSLRFDQIDFGHSAKSNEQKIPIHELLRNACNRVRVVKTQPASMNLKERE